MKLRCENLVKKYGPRTVVKGVSMEVNQGEIVADGKPTEIFSMSDVLEKSGFNVSEAEEL